MCVFAHEMGRVVSKGHAMEAALKEVCQQVTPKNQDLPLIHGSLLTDTSWLLLGPQFTKYTLTHAIHRHYTTHTTNRRHTTNTTHTHTHTTQKQNPQIITYLQLFSSVQFSRSVVSDSL